MQGIILLPSFSHKLKKITAKRHYYITFLISIIFSLRNLANGIKILQPEDSFLLWSKGFFSITIDVRSKEEYYQGHIPGAYFVENMAFDSTSSSKFVSKVQGCKSCSIAMYCQSGPRASMASTILEKQGFKNIYNILGVNQLFSYGYPQEIGKPKNKLSEPACVKDPTICVHPPTSQPTKMPSLSPVKPLCPDEYWTTFNVPKWKKTERNCGWINKLMPRKRNKFCRRSFSDAAKICPDSCKGLCKCADVKWRRFEMPDGSKRTCFKLGQKKLSTIKKFCVWHENAKVLCPHTCAGWCQIWNKRL
mmetsp:Transcript_7863/g.11226  ORF Transcript_7863/g.11226 Transcript_7863/m.11226 type:complete len:305 (+) Transcript_7863:3-917(+)